jgi:hypothetical protein
MAITWRSPAASPIRLIVGKVFANHAILLAENERQNCMKRAVSKNNTFKNSPRPS